MRRLCPLDQQVLYALHTHRIPFHPCTSLTRISCTPTGVDQPLKAASAHQRSSANRSRTSRSVRQCSTTTATAHARLYHHASTQIQASHQTHPHLAQPIRPTAKHTRPPHQAQVAPGATATTYPEKSHKKSNSTRFAPFHNPIPSANLHACINLHQPLLHRREQQDSPRPSPSAKSTVTTPQRQPRLLSWRRNRAIISFRRRWELRGRGWRRRIHLTCLSRR